MELCTIEFTSETVCFYLAFQKINGKKLEALHANMDILNTGLDVCHPYERNSLLKVYRRKNTEETGKIDLIVISAKFFLN